MKYSFGHAAFAVTDLETSLKFYCEVLGWKKGFGLRDDNGEIWLQYVEFAPQEYLELFPEGKADQIPGMAFKHLAIMVDDLAALLDDLKAKGIPMFNGPGETAKAENPLPAPAVAPCSSLTAWIADPDGNFIEFMQFTPESLHLHPEKWK